MTVEVSDFQAQVIEESFSRPVLVDFWAPWCGPCRMFSPIVERVADDAGDAWALAKVNTDVHQDVARQYRVNSIPAVKLFVDGRVSAEFVGVKPEDSLRKWLATAVPNDTSKTIARAEEAIESGEDAEAERLLEGVLASEPDNADAALLLARSLLFRDPRRAESLARGATVEARRIGLRDSVLTVAGLTGGSEAIAALPESPARDRYLEAVRSLADNDLDAALGGFIDVLRRDKNLDNQGARRAAVAVFALLGEQHKLTQKHRRAFQMAMF